MNSQEIKGDVTMDKRIQELKSLHVQSGPEFTKVILNINAAVKEGDSKKLKFILSGLVPALKSYHTVIDELFTEISAQQKQIEDQANQIESLKWKVAHLVMCQGICTSQRDDYCGMHMSNESCVACNRIWTNAHVENAKWDQAIKLNLAIKALERIANIENEKPTTCSRCKGAGYHHGFGVDGHDPDYCEECGGLQEIFASERDIARTALSEIGGSQDDKG